MPKRPTSHAPQQLDLLFGDVPLPPAGEDATGRRRYIQLGSEILAYALRRSRRRSIGFLIEEAGLRVTAPYWVTLPQIEQAIRDKQRWIVGKLSESRTRRLPVRVEWRDGATLPFLGAELTLRLGGGLRPTCREDGQLWLALPADADTARIRDAACAWLQQQAQADFESRAARFAQRLGVMPRRIALSSARTQWGSCTVDRVVRLNWRLIHFAPAIIDYVVAHELAHLKEMNHSRAFWNTVGELMPDYELSRRELRQHHPARLPTV